MAQYRCYICHQPIPHAEESSEPWERLCDNHADILDQDSVGWLRQPPLVSELESIGKLPQ